MSQNNSPMIKSSKHYEERNPAVGGGCSCCNPKNLRRSWKKSAKRKESIIWKRDMEREQ